MSANLTGRNSNLSLQLRNLKQQLEQIGISEQVLLSEEEDSFHVVDAEEDGKQVAGTTASQQLKRLSSRDQLRVDALKRENYRQRVIKVCLLVCITCGKLDEQQEIIWCRALWLAIERREKGV